MHSVKTLKALYITALLVIIMLTGLFIGSFFFFDRANHKTFYYSVTRDEKPFASVKIDRFYTEERIIFKQTTETPFDPLFASSKTKLVYDRQYTLDQYTEDRVTRGDISVLTRLENKNNLASFLSRYQSRIVTVNTIPTRKDVFVFCEDLPLTYLPIIENYDFRKGRSQGFFAYTFPSPFLPPMKRYVTLTSIRDEYLKVEGRRIKTEKLLLKVKDFVRGSVWVSKSDRKVIMIELPRSGIVITRSFSPVTVKAKAPTALTGPYTAREVLFKSDTISLAGTLTAPPEEGKHPAILLVPAKGPYTRDYMGLFSSIAGYFSRNGFATLRFDKRGTGASGGEASWPLMSERIQDIAAAVTALANQPEVDPERVAILIYEDGALEATMAVTATSRIAGVVYMAPEPYVLTDYERIPTLIGEAAGRNRWGKEFQELVRKASRETKDRAMQSKFNWAYVLRKRCFLGSLKERIQIDPIAEIVKLSTPALIVQDLHDQKTIIEAAPTIERALSEAGNKSAALVYFDNVGHLFGTMVTDGTHQIHYEANTTVLDTIRAWLNKNMPKKEPEPPAEPLIERAPKAPKK